MTITFSGITISGGGVQLLTAGAAPGPEPGPSPSPGGDPYWGNVILLMNTSSSNNKTNDTWLDSSVNNLTFNYNNTVYQSSFSPYPVSSNTIPYSTANNGGSTYFDGTGDWVYIRDNVALQFNTGNFTVETWVYPIGNTYTANRGITGRGAKNISGWELSLYSNNMLFAVSGNVVYSTNATVTGNTWSHVAWSRSGSNSNIYLNGNLVKTFTDSSNYNQASNLIIGGEKNTFSSSVDNPWQGYLSDYRAVKGTAVYTANFSVPTQPLAAISNTSLLVTMNNLGVYDATQTASIPYYAVSSNRQAKFGSTSLIGNIATYVEMINKDPSPFTSDFTVESWAYANSSTGNREIVSFDTSDYGIFLVGTTNNATFRFNGTNYVSNTTVSTNTWVHYALVRSGSTANLYVNGNLASSQNIGLANIVGNQSSIDIATGHSGTADWLGWIDELRITNGIARYTANFAVPSAAFPTYY